MEGIRERKRNSRNWWKMVKKILLLILLWLLCFYIKGYADEADYDEADYGGPPYHLEKEDPEIYRIKLYRAYLVRSDGLEVDLYNSTSGMTIDLVNGQFTPVAEVDIPAGTYTQIKIITSTTFGLKGYVEYKGSYYYTKTTTQQDQIGGPVADIPTGQSDYGIQTATLEDPGEGTEVGPRIGGDPTFIYTDNINLQVDIGKKPRIRVEFLADDALELNDSTPNIIDNGAPAQITFAAPTMDVSTF